MKNKKLILLWCCIMSMIACEESSFKSELEDFQVPSDLKYASITDARETKAIVTAAPTIQTGGLTPTFEIVSISTEDGTVLDDSYMEYISVGEVTSGDYQVDPELGKVDENGNPITFYTAENASQNGIISIADGHEFTVGDYYFTIKVTTESDGVKYETTFDDAFHLFVSPLLPSNLIYSLKNQNLVYGDPESKTREPILPNSNPDVSFELVDYTDKLQIDPETGSISLAPGYAYSTYDTISPTVKVISNITEESVVFEDKVTTIITDKPEEMPVETINIFYPTLRTSGLFPTSGEGFSIQVDNPGEARSIWGNLGHGAMRDYVGPPDRPEENTSQTILGSQTYANGSSTTKPNDTWLVINTQDLTPFQYGYKLSFTYYYQAHYVNYLADGRTPTDMEVYISTDYTGGDIRDPEGNWLNGTWTQVNEVIRCRRATVQLHSDEWGEEFIGTPYPGYQTGPDPDGRKNPDRPVNGYWIKCEYDIPVDQISPNFTVAFNIRSYFEGEILNNDVVPGRGGIYFFSDFNFKGVEIPID
ncbi:hypothetical protein [Sinomicrobium sp.]